MTELPQQQIARLFTQVVYAGSGGVPYLYQGLHEMAGERSSGLAGGMLLPTPVLI